MSESWHYNILCLLPTKHTHLFLSVVNLIGWSTVLLQISIPYMVNMNQIHTELGMWIYHENLFICVKFQGNQGTQLIVKARH